MTRAKLTRESLDAAERGLRVKKIVPDGLAEAMRPQPFPAEGLGLEFFATMSDLAALQDALDEDGILAVMHRLLRSDLEALNHAAQWCIAYSDRTPWKGEIDALPVDAITLGIGLADAIHRRIFGRPLEIAAPED